VSDHDYVAVGSGPVGSAPTLVRGHTAALAMAIGERAADLVHDRRAAPPRVAAEV
jgi:hypothetical protein